MVYENNKVINSAIVIGYAGATGVHENSIATYQNTAFVACGDSVFALKIPSLEQIWCKQTDDATCLGIYWLDSRECLISHGELEIRRLDLLGNIIWCASGADIFTEGFIIHENHIEVIDFNNNRYLIDIVSGNINLI